MTHVGERSLVGRLGPQHVVEPEGPDSARVDETLDPGLRGRPEDVLGPAHVDVVEGAGVAGPEAVQGGDVEDGTTADDRLPDVVRIPQVADHLRDVEAVEVPRVGAALDQRDESWSRATS